MVGVLDSCSGYAWKWGGCLGQRQGWVELLLFPTSVCCTGM